jgi:hypothetical protein
MKKTVHAAGWPRCTRSILFAVTFIFILVDHALARRAIPDDNLAYPVLITLKTSTGLTSFGSGIYLNTGNAVYLVTAKHVLAPGLLPNPATQTELELLSYSKDLPVQKRILITVNLSTMRASGDVKPHPSQDVIVVKLATVVPAPNGTATPAPNGTTTPAPDGEGPKQLSFLPGVTMRESAESGLVTAGIANVKSFDQVLVGNDAIFYGYPVSLGLPENPQFDSFRPLLRKALIAGQDPQKKSIIIDGPVYRGNSGGPVFQIEPDGFQTHFSLVGLLTEFVPMMERTPDFTFALNSGYSIAKPMDFVLELIK